MLSLDRSRNIVIDCLVLIYFHESKERPQHTTPCQALSHHLNGQIIHGGFKGKFNGEAHFVIAAQAAQGEQIVDFNFGLFPPRTYSCIT